MHMNTTQYAARYKSSHNNGLIDSFTGSQRRSSEMFGKCERCTCKSFQETGEKKGNNEVADYLRIRANLCGFYRRMSAALVDTPSRLSAVTRKGAPSGLSGRI